MKAVKFKQFELVIALCAIDANAFSASPISVSNTNDDGDGSLRAAITQANMAGGGEVTFCVTNTITLLSPLPSLTNISITGPGTNLLTISGGNQVSIFSMNGGTTNTLSGLTIADGMAQGSFEPEPLGTWTYASGIANSGSLKLLNCVVRNCSNADYSYGMGIYNGGDMEMEESTIADCSVPSGDCVQGSGIYNSGALRMTDCRVSRCGVAVAEAAGGAIPKSGSATPGGGILNAGSLTMSSSVIETCSAGIESEGGGICNWGAAVICGCTVSNCYGYDGGGIGSSGSGILTMTNSTIVDNNSQDGGGLRLWGGTNVMVGCTVSGNSATGAGVGAGIFNPDGILLMSNCTIGENAMTENGDPGAGIYNGPSVWGGTTKATIYMDHCTVAFNTNAGYGGGVANGGVFYSQNSIFAGNSTEDFAGVLTSQGYNLIENTNGCTITNSETGDIYGVDPLLGPLQDNGGPTWTCALLPGSRCIDQGTSGGLSTDQRAVPRPYVVPGIPEPPGGDGSDIGAFEWTPPPSAFQISLNGSPTASVPCALTITVVDQYQKTSTLVAGDHNFTFGGLAVADDGTYPTITDKYGNPVNLGSLTTITFTNGVNSAGGSLVAYKAQTATLTGSDAASGLTTSGPGGFGASLTIANVAPLGGTHFLVTTVGTPLLVSVSTLANLDYDANHDLLTITAVSPISTNGPANNVSLAGGTITYTPAAGFVGADQFTYTISDGYGGTATSTANVTVRLAHATSTFNYISPPDGNGNVNLRGYGIPGRAYDVQRSTDLLTWTTISGPTGINALGNALLLYTDNPGSGMAFYRFAVH